MDIATSDDETAGQTRLVDGADVPLVDVALDPNEEAFRGFWPQAFDLND